MATLSIKLDLDSTAQVDAIASALEMSLVMMADQRKGAGFAINGAGRTSYSDEWTRQDEARFTASRQAYEAVTGQPFKA